MRGISVFSAFLTLLAASFVSAHEYSSNATACTRYYTVQESDTCDIIGQKTLTSTYQVLAYNLPQAGATCYNLQTGAVSASAYCSYTDEPSMLIEN